MAHSFDFDRSLFRKNLDAARQRLQRSQTDLAHNLKGEAVQDLAYGMFEDALAAAGWARALGEQETSVNKLLAIAAKMAVEVFHRRGQLLSTITFLPDGKEDTFTDTSETNAWTIVKALYAALVADLPEVLDQLTSLSPQDYHSDQVTVSPLLEQYSHDLSLVIKGKSQVGPQLENMLDQEEQNSDMVSRYWLAQMKALDKLVGNDADGFQAALEELSNTLKNYYTRADERNNPERFLELPVLGLRALGKRFNVLNP